ncbi:Flavin-containing monooxygenase FMO GS-OX-like 4 [Platanthera guangdongensis]|uniref:Flavin-containing monooxygenase n=1 Tax=Platanthera guangdongensis TaxID=2320717 RepID=A0ABR2MZW0_9ASPA
MFRRSIAVIGAGASGLVAARELRREGHDVVVFERGGTVGGTWVYTPAIESDLLGLDPNRKVIHSSLYNSLRTNLPRECMGFFDYPFVPVNEINDHDPRRFPGHGEVLRYLESFSRDNDLYLLIRFGTEVVSVEMEKERGWAVRSLKIGAGRDRVKNEVYDGVVVCSGHYTEPRVADIPGIEIWPGKQMHSHNYRIPQPFLGQVCIVSNWDCMLARHSGFLHLFIHFVIVVIGSSASAADISREIAGFAREVHGASRSSCPGAPMKQPGYDNLWLHSMLFSGDVSLVRFGWDAPTAVGLLTVPKDALIEKGKNTLAQSGAMDDKQKKRKGPPETRRSEKHVTGIPKTKFRDVLAWAGSLVATAFRIATMLIFLSQVVPFPLCELQSKWVAGVLSGRIALPTPEKMLEDVDALYSEMEQARWPHIGHFEYDDWLASQCGHPLVEEWRKQMYKAASKNKVVRPDNYRDEWDDDDLVSAAHEDFKKILTYQDVCGMDGQ